MPSHPPFEQGAPFPKGAALGAAFGCESLHLTSGTLHPEKSPENNESVEPVKFPVATEGAPLGAALGAAFFTLAEAVELAGVQRPPLERKLTKLGFLSSQISQAGHNKGRIFKTVAPADLFTAYPAARGRWEAAQRKKEVTAVVQAPPRVIPLPEPEAVQAFQDWQRRRMDARVAILRHIDKVAQELTSQPHPRWKFRTPTRDRAVLLVCADALSGRLPDDIQALIPVANARSGASGDRSLSRRTLQRWTAEAKQGMEGLAPKAVVHPEPLWAQPLLDLYRQPQKPSLRHVTIEVLPGLLPLGVKPPSYDAARRWLDKVGTVERERGRMLPRELKTRLPFVRRTFADLLPLDVVSADGHTFDAEVQHPETGRPFRPEMTAFIDIATRKVIGWSVALAECAITVGDAWRHAATSHGVFAIFYTDNGSGYVNEQIQALAARLGTRLENSIPYNSQARGVIERLNKTLWIHLCAKHLPTYVGKDMDRQARQIVYKHTRKVEKSTALIPWETFLTFAGAVVDHYNGRPHGSLPRITDAATGKIRHSSPSERWDGHLAQGWAPEATVEGLDEFMPQEIRTVIRGEVSLFGHTYFSRELTEWDGCKVRVGYDVHDASRVWIRNEGGALLCEAGFEANARRYFPTSVVEEARHTRLQAQLRRLEEKAGRLLPPEPQSPIDIEDVTPHTLEVSAQQLRKLGLEEPAEPQAEAAPQPGVAPREPQDPDRRPFFKDGKEFALWILEHPDKADAEELLDIQTRLRKDPLYRTWLGLEDEASVPASASVSA